ncbi:IS3 family transposase [Escherichia coli]
MGSCAAPSAKGDDKFITTDYLQQCHNRWRRHSWCGGLSPEQFENKNLA